MRLRNRKSYVTNLPEGVAPRKAAMSLVRLLYFGALIAFLLYLLYYAWERLIYVEAPGYVAMERHLLQTDREGMVRGLDLRVGDAVKKGQQLFRIEQEVVDDRRDAAVWERLKMQREIGLKKAALASLRREIARKQARLGQLSQFKLLELDRDRQREFSLLGQDVESDRLKAEGLEQEITALGSYLGSLRGQEGYQRHTVATPYVSPFDGFVYRLEKGEHEFAHKGDSILVLEDARHVRIRAYFTLEDMPRVNAGRGVSIILPDGQSLAGEVERLDSASIDQQEKLAHGYQPLEALVRVVIRPGTTEMVDWRRFNQLDVQVRFHVWD